MSSYTLVVFIHVASAVVLVGGGLLVTPTVNEAIRRSSTISDLRRWLNIGRPLGLINPVSSIALLASGVYLASVGDWWTASWVQTAVVLWIVNAVLAGVVVKPSMRRVAQLAFGSVGEWIGPQLDAARRSPRLAAASDVMLAADVGVLFLMVVKPSGYLTAMAAVLVALLAVFGFNAVRRPAPVMKGIRAE